MTEEIRPVGTNGQAFLNYGDLTLKRADFNRVTELVGGITGMNLHDGKEDLVKARLLKRLRLLGLPSFAAYLDYVEEDASGKELRNLVDVLTTNKTFFFRENEHFDYLRERVIPAAQGRKLRIWSAGCSSGEEPYSIGMLLREELPAPDSWDVKILATDISGRVLDKARARIYELEALAGLDPRRLDLHFSPVQGRQRPTYKVDEAVAGLSSFAHLNLMGDWPMQGPFDVIFCRNVMIYFDPPTREALVNRFHGLLRPGGWLFVGHSESLAPLKHPYRYAQPAIYQRQA
jgi:chemotaxis protein methyltransferase CheR